MITFGDEKSAEYYVVCEPPSGGFNRKYPTSTRSINLFVNELKANDIDPKKFFFVQLCEPIPETATTDSKKNKFLEEYKPQVLEHLKDKNRPVITMGAMATRCVFGKAVSITSSRGTVINSSNGHRIFPILSPNQCLRVLENMPIFKSDIKTLKRLMENDFNIKSLDHSKNVWIYDLQPIIDAKPRIIALDTETTGLNTYLDSFQILTAQICYDCETSYVIPLHKNFWPEKLYSDKKLRKLRNQFAQICGDKTIRKIGHNINYDRHVLAAEDIEDSGWLADTELLVAIIDENMRLKNLDNSVRRFVPEEAGFNDYYNSIIDKSDMISLDRDTMLAYAGNDARVTLKLFNVLWEQLKKNPREYHLYCKLKFPTLLAFKYMEREGLHVDRAYMDELAKELEEEVTTLHKELLDAASKTVLRRHLADNKKKKEDPLRLSRASLVSDILFTKEGFGLTPVVYTDGTAKEEKLEDRVPSTSTKDHLPFFEHLENDAGDWVRKFMQYKELSTLLSKYVVNFHKYIHQDGKVHGTFSLSRTNTGRTSSSNPNLQNIPSRGKWAKKYKQLFIADPNGEYVYVSADLSQIELRLIAWESNDPAMLKAYRDGVDIHALTARVVSGKSEEQWNALGKSEKKSLRTLAKAVNFGLVYGMYPKSFQAYAKTQYGVSITLDEATRIRNAFFALYRGLEGWHNRRKQEAHSQGYVDSLHGYRKNVPSIYSNESRIVMGAERNAINAPIQGFGSDLGCLAIARINRQVDRSVICPILFIHDDIVLKVKKGHELEAVNMLLWVLNNPPLKSLFGIEAPIPIYGEPDIGETLGTMYELYDLPEDAPQYIKDISAQVKPQKPSWWDDSKDII